MYNNNLPSIEGCGKAFGTFGELLQGILPSSRMFLVTFPANIYAEIKFSVNNSGVLTVSPAHKKKALHMANIILQYYNLPLGGHLVIKSEIREGKGMASSSADLVATAKAINNAYHLDLSSKDIERFMSEIEPSDGVMYEACVSYYHRETILRSYLGCLPKITIIAVDEGGEVDTVKFAQKQRYFTHSEKIEYAKLLNKIEHAVRKSDLKCIGEVSTRSAILNQRLKPNKYLREFIEANNLVGGLGVAIAHSGTCIGLLLDGSDKNLQKKVRHAKKLFRALSVLEPVTVYQQYCPSTPQVTWRRYNESKQK